MIISHFEKFQAKLCDEIVKIIKILEKRLSRISSNSTAYLLEKLSEKRIMLLWAYNGPSPFQNRPCQFHNFIDNIKSSVILKNGDWNRLVIHGQQSKLCPNKTGMILT